MSPERASLARRAASEALGTAFLLAVVIGSGIMGERLSGGNVAIALLANTLATGAGLVALIHTFGAISGAHFNPVVSISDATRGGLPWREVAVYGLAQLGGAFLGVAVAHVMFGEPVFFASMKERAGNAQLVSEFVATFGLIATIHGTVRARPEAVPFAVGAYITSAADRGGSGNPHLRVAAAHCSPPAAHCRGCPTQTRRHRMKTVLFACVHNAGRSQMAAAWFNALSDPAQARGISAGTEPASRVHPEVLEVMREVGIDLAGEQPKLLSEALAREATLLVTMGCGEACPVVPGLRRQDWPLEDPKGKPLDRVREIRGEVRDHVVRLVSEQGWARPIDIQPLGEMDVAAVRALLEQQRLPTQGVSQTDGFYVARANDQVIGSIGVEHHGDAGLLRSLVVDAAQQKKGVASGLVQRAVAHGTQRGLKALYLLTTTAPGFFEKHGFARCPRSEAPPGIKDSWEFQTGCPDAAIFMRRWLSN